MGTIDVPVADIRRALRERVRDAETIHRSTLIRETAHEHDVTREAVRHEVATLVRQGELYEVGDDDPEVRVP